MKKIKNLKEFKALIKLYESMDEKELDRRIEKFKRSILRKADNMTRNIPLAEMATSMGDITICTLCGPVGINETGCDHCIYVVRTGDKCFTGDNSFTYNRLHGCTLKKDILELYKARAKHMKALLTKEDM